MRGFVLHGNQLRLDGRRVGWITTIDKKRVFVSPRKRRTHYMRIFKGWGLSKAVLTYLKEREVDEIHLKVYKDQTLISPLQAWLEHGIVRQFRPFETQVFLPEKYMTQKRLTPSQILEQA